MNQRCISTVALVILALLQGVGLSFARAADEPAGQLEAGFREPPDSAKPHVWWHWMNGNVTKEGITADLEAMKHVGIGGAQIFHVGEGIPEGPVRFLSPEWSEMVAHAIREADRLGIELCVHNCAGWSSSGGPWVTPEHAMMVVVTSEQAVKGPSHFNAVLPHPASRLDYYRDIAVLAFPTPAGEGDRMVDAAPRVTGTTEGFEGARLIDGRRETTVMLPAPTADQSQDIQIEFAKPYSARRLTITPGPGRSDCRGALEISSDGRTYKPIAHFSLQRQPTEPAAPVIVDFEPCASKFYRTRFSADGGRRPTRINLAEIELSAAFRIEGIVAKTFADRGDVSKTATPKSFGPALAVAREKTIDLTAKLDQAGKLEWDVPDGNWTILRVGYTPNGRNNHPAPKEGTGLEVDKLSREAMDAFFEQGMMRQVLKAAGPHVGKSLKNALIDSYEVGTQNWTPQFRAEFQKRRGYDPVPFLPAFTARVVDDPAQTERFLWDLRRTIADLFAENYSARFAELCHENGLVASVEPYGNGPFDDFSYGAPADIIMGEFWSGGGVDGSVKLAASVAHTNGRRYVGAESFTASPENGKWLNTPWSLKQIGDQAFCVGVNRLIFHRYAMQPWKNIVPGMTMGQWGFHFERTNTWWEQAPAWTKYLARCQFLLQQGRFAADAVYYCGEGAPNSLRAGNPALPSGYDYDGCGTNVIMSGMCVEDGRIALPSGSSYRVLILPPDETMTPSLLQKVEQLAREGATVVGPKPLRSPSLQGYPACDDEVRKIADRIWGACDGKKVTENRVGKGRVVWGEPLEQLFAGMKLPPDFETSQSNVRWIHRIVGETDVYFVSNQSKSVVDFDAWFRASGKAPELWDAESGQISDAPIFEVKEGRTRVALRLDPAGSVFVVFRRPAPTNALVSLDRQGPPVVSQTRKSKLVIVKAVYGAFPKEGEGWVDVTRQVKALAARGERKVPATNDMAGSDPANNIIKDLRVDVIVAGERKRLSAQENHTLELPAGAEIERALYGEIPADTDLKERVIDLTAKLAGMVHDDTLSVVSGNELAGHDPAYLTPKQLRIEYTLDGAHRTVTVGENQQLTLPTEDADAWNVPTHELTARGNTLELEVWAPGSFTLKGASGRSTRVAVPSPASPLEISGPWALSFPPGRGAPDQVVLEKLISWPEHTNDGVKYFSGSATYSRTIDIPADRLGPGKALYLDLGKVKNFAEPVLNGKSLGILWKPPFRVEITGAARPGKNTLEVRVTNLWPNRLIGDEQLPEDVEWSGIRLKAWPEWLLENKPRTSGRITFTTWHHWKKDDQLLESGLLGPVRFVSSLRVPVACPQ